MPQTPPPPPAHEPISWADPERAAAFSQWLAQLAPSHGFLPETAHLASLDASFRRYFRVMGTVGAQASSCIVMDAPPLLEDCKPFVKVANLLHAAQLKAPAVLAWDEAQGFMLLSDLGSQTMMQHIAPPEDVHAIAKPTAQDIERFKEATDLLVRWQLASRPGLLPDYDDALLSRELALFPDWYVAQHKGFAMSAEQQTVLNEAFDYLKDSALNALGGARVLVHRDFMPRNLMVDEADGQLGILDFQDAVYGPITYDIASLMRDAFVSWEEDVVLDITVRYWQKARAAGLPVGDDFGEFYRAVELMGLQRHLKILGIFARLSLRDGKPKYLADTPRFVRYARATCMRYRRLGPLMVLLDAIEGNETRVGYTF